MLSASDLRSGYGIGDVLQGFALAIEAGEVVSVLGRNGVGKTTLMKTLIGLLPARRGRIEYRGQDITALGAFRRARLGIGYVPQGRGIFPHMTVRDNLRMGGLVNEKRRSLDFEAVFGYFPLPPRAAGAAGRNAERRPAGDAGHRPRPHQTSPSCCCSTSRATACSRAWCRSWAASSAP